MPRYDFQCPDCGRTEELTVGLNDEVPVITCPADGVPMIKQLGTFSRVKGNFTPMHYGR